MCALCVRGTRFAGAPDDRRPPAPRRAPGRRPPPGVRRIRSARSVFACVRRSRRLRGLGSRSRGRGGAGRILVPPGTRGHPFVEPMRSGSHAVQRRVSAAVRQGPTTPTRRPHASGQVINGSCALPARGAGASVPRTHMPTCASRDPLEPAVLRAVARQQVCANLRHRKRRHRGISYSRI